ncbi:hypothetical protein KM043_013027 [Ampulex compressa]|nr:hypothetical protein KM043_013027 [Ampulex compressa]
MSVARTPNDGHTTVIRTYCGTSSRPVTKTNGAARLPWPPKETRCRRKEYSYVERGQSEESLMSSEENYNASRVPTSIRESGAEYRKKQPALLNINAGHKENLTLRWY